MKTKQDYDLTDQIGAVYVENYWIVGTYLIGCNLYES